MNRLTLEKAAIDFAFANSSLDAIALAEGSIAEFRKQGGAADDLMIWSQTVTRYVQQFDSLNQQKLPSEMKAAQRVQGEPKPSPVPQG